MSNKTIKIGLSDSDKAAMQAVITALVKANLITAYSSSATYALGDFVYYDGKFYKCTTAISTAEAWTSAHWSEATLNDVIDKVNQAANSVENKLSKGDYDATTGVGYADNADNLVATKGLTVNDDPMSYGMVGGAQKSAVGDGNASLNKLVCVDVVRNQALNVGTDTTVTVSGLVFTRDANSRRIHISGTSTESRDVVPLSGLVNTINYIPQGNKILLAGINAIKNTGITIGLYDCGNTSNGDWIATSGITSNHKLYVSFNSGITVDIYIEPSLINITQCYGNNDVVNAIIGTDASKQVERLLAFDPEILSDTDYDAGTLVPSKSAKLLSVGVNQWDEEFALNTYWDVSTGAKTSNTNWNACANLQRCIGGVPLYIYMPNPNVRFSYILWFDGNKAFLYGESCRANGVHQPPYNAKYFAFNISKSEYGGSTYNHDICINVSDPNINGKYYPSKRTPVTLPNYEGHGILKVVDGKVVADGTELYPDGNSKKRWISINLGQKDYTKGERNNSDTGYIYYFRDTSIRATSTLSICTRLQNAGYVVAWENLELGQYTIVTGGYIVICSSLTTPEAVKSSLNGVTLVAKLVTEEDITTPVYQSTFPVEQGGTLQFLDENDNPIAGLQGSEIFYQKNIKTFVEALGEATDWDPERIKRLGNLSFTPEYDDISLSPTPVGAYARAQVYNATFTIVISATFSGTANGSITMQDSVIDLSTEFQNTKPAEKIIDADGKAASEAPTTPDCPIAYFVGRTKEGTLRWCLLHSAANEIKVHFEEAVPLDANGDGIIDCRASLIL